MKYIAKKLLAMAATILLVSFLVFLAFAVIPGDPATSMLGTEATPEKVAALQEELGLNQPLPVRYVSWLGGMLRGDFGTSYSYQMPVGQMVGDKIPVTLTLTLLSFVMMCVVSVPLGIFAARHEGGRVDQIILAVNQLIMAVPPFFSGILITLFFGVILQWFTPGGYVSYEVNPGKFLGYLIFPAAAIALPKAAMAVKLLRSAVIEQMKQDYVRTAYSRGNGTKQVLYRHVLKNAMIPVVTFLGMALADMVAGSIIIEQVFNIPGIGRILLTSISNRDYPVVQAIITALAFLVILINFLVDLIYRFMDPRITWES